MSKPKKGIWFRLLSTESQSWLLAALFVNGALILYTTYVTLKTFSLSPDEYAYQISAQLFSQGKIAIPSPQPSYFFNVLSCVNNGSFYGKYPPGWPVLLALGNHLGLDWLINPCFGLLSLIVIYFFIRTLFSPVIANTAMILTLACPYFIFNSSCLMPHASCLLLVTLAAYFLLASGDTFVSFLGFGMTAGFAFLNRPFTALLALAPLVLYVIYKAFLRRDSSVFRGLLFGSAPIFAFFVCLFLFYNYLQTGHPFLQPFQIYNPYDRLGFSSYTLGEFWGRFQQKIINRTSDWVIWTGGLPFLVLLFWTRGLSLGSDYRKGVFLSMPALFLLVGYFFYIGSGVFQFGPRYLYESYGLFLIPAAMGVMTTKRWAPLVLGICLTLNGIIFFVETPIYGKLADEHARFFEIVHRLSNAIVFIQAGDDSAYYTRNGLDFKAPVLLVLDCGAEKNRELIQHYPERSYYLYTGYAPDWDHLLIPYEEKLAKRP